MCGVASGHDAERWRRMIALSTKDESVDSAACRIAGVAGTVFGVLTRIAGLSLRGVSKLWPVLRKNASMSAIAIRAATAIDARRSRIRLRCDCGSLTGDHTPTG